MSDSFCDHASACGGCGLLQFTYSDQLSRKETLLARALGPHVAPDVLRGPFFSSVQAGAAPPAAFRQKVSFVFARGNGGRGIAMGHFRRGTQDVVPIHECPVHSGRGNRLAFALRDVMARFGVPAYMGDDRGLLRHVIVRTSRDDRQAVMMLVVSRNDPSLRKPVRAFLSGAEKPDGLMINIHSRAGPYMVGEQTLHIAGPRHIKEEVGGVSYLISPDAFFQTNVDAAGELQQLVLEAVSGATTVLDLYCGSGLFSLPIARAGAVVTGIEENRRAIDDAQSNARLNRIASNRVRFLPGRVESVLGRVRRDTWDAVILDPPRQGCSPEVLRAVASELRPRRLVYVSCNPDALANELPTITAAGYAVTAVRAVDMFPHTDHIEAAVTLDRSR